MKQSFIFKFSNRDNWQKIRDNLTAEINGLLRAHYYGEGKDFQVDIGKPKRSDSQLAGYWVLIDKIVDWFVHENQQIITKGQASEYVKRAANFVEEIGGEIVSRTLQKNGDCTKEEMSIILMKIQELGDERLQDWTLEPREMRELLQQLKS